MRYKNNISSECKYGIKKLKLGTELNSINMELLLCMDKCTDLCVVQRLTQNITISDVIILLGVVYTAADSGCGRLLISSCSGILLLRLSPVESRPQLTHFLN